MLSPKERLAVKFHPDKCKDDGDACKKKFYKIQAAYEEIKEIKGQGVVCFGSQVAGPRAL